jgi:hypothetical protein
MGHCPGTLATCHSLREVIETASGGNEVELPELQVDGSGETPCIDLEVGGAEVIDGAAQAVGGVAAAECEQAEDSIQRAERATRISKRMPLPSNCHANGSGKRPPR